MSVATVAILGPGGVGGFLAGAFLVRRCGNVVVVAREPTAATIGRDGIVLSSTLLGEVTVRPTAVEQLDRAVDVLFVTTKADGLDAALERIVAEPALVVPLLNGLDHLPRLRERFGERAIAASIRIEADRPQPGRIVQSSPAAIVDLASEDRAMAPAVAALGRQLAATGVTVRIRDREAEVMWSKLVRLNALAATTSAYDLPLGEIRSDRQRRAALVAAVEETAAVAVADGAAIDPAATLAELDAADPRLGSSMRRDIAAGRTPELDAITGAVLRAAARHGIRCPTVSALAVEVAARAGIAPPAGA